jgi:hypothetical protein
LIQRLIGRRTKPTFCVFPVFSVAVMEKCCDACRDGEYYFRSVFWVSKGAGVSWASTAVNRKSMRHTMADRSSNEADFLCILLYLAWRLWKECCDASRDWEYYFRSDFSVSEGAGVSLVSIAVERKSMLHTMANRSSNEAAFLCIPCN